MVEFDTKRGSVIDITVGTNREVIQLCSKQLSFVKALKIIEMNWESGPGSISLSCIGISHDCLREYIDRVT